MDNNFKNDLIIAYDQDAKRRKANEDKRDGWKADVRKKFMDLLKNENKKTLLELGAGIGTDAKYFMENGFNVTAIDISEGMVKECINKGINAKVMDLYHLEELKKKFDAIYSMNVMLHVPRADLDMILRKILMILNRGGLFYYGTYGGITEEKIINDKKTNYMPRFFSKLNDNDLLDATKMFVKVDFEIIDIKSDQKGFHYQSLILRKPS